MYSWFFEDKLLRCETRAVEHVKGVPIEGLKSVKIPAFGMSAFDISPKARATTRPDEHRPFSADTTLLFYK
jgi:hypothetical protein